MSNERGNTDQSPFNDGESKIDSIAKAAGSPLRHPAPTGGAARLQPTHRRRQTVRAAAAGTVLAALAITLFVVAGRDSDEDGVVVTPPPSIVENPPDSEALPASTAPNSTFAPGSTVSPTTVVDTTTTTSEAAAITDAPQTTASSQPIAPLTWADATDRFPNLAYIACCGTDWEGEPSPPVPTDANVAMEAGIYNARTPNSDGIHTSDDISDGVLTLEVRSYGRCSDGVVRCSGDEPYPANALGTTDEPSRVIDVVLDDAARVAVTGFGCNGAANMLFEVRETGTGSDLLALYRELAAAYEIAVGAPLRNGVPPEQIASDIATNKTAGFFDPGCPSWTPFAWSPVVGPSLLAPLNLYTIAGQPPLEPNDDIALQSVFPTAISVDENGVMTIYLYGGFLS